PAHQSEVTDHDVGLLVTLAGITAPGRHPLLRPRDSGWLSAHAWLQQPYLVASMQSVPRHIQTRQIGHFYRADPEYGCGVAEGLRLRMADGLHGEPVTAARSRWRGRRITPEVSPSSR